MKILFFAQNFPKSHHEAVVSGVVKIPFYHACLIAEEGNEVSVITSGKSGKWNLSGINIYGAGNGFFKGVFKAFIAEIKMMLMFFHIRKKNFDLIHVHTGNLIFLFLLKKIGIIKTPIVYSVHGTSTPELKASLNNEFSIRNILLKINGKIQEFIDKFMWKNADILISGSKYQFTEMGEIYNLNLDKIVCVYNMVDRSRYYPDKYSGINRRKELNIPQKSKVILFVGRWGRKKGIHLLIQSASRVLSSFPDTYYVFVVGNIGKHLDYRREIISMLKKSKLSKRFLLLENVPEYNLPSFYNMSDLCVFPSLKYESIPTVIYEAMACKKPIITQGSWGIPEVLNSTLLSEEELLSNKLPESISNHLSNIEVSDYSDNFFTGNNAKIWECYKKIYSDLIKE